MILDRFVSVRVLLLAVLTLLVLGVLCAWGSVLFVQERATGLPARLSFQFSQFPERVKMAYGEVRAGLSDHGQERFFRVPADVDPVAAGFTPVGDGIFLRADRDRALPAWHFLAGAFRIDGVAQNAIVVLSPDYELAALVPVDESHLRATLQNPGMLAPEHRKLVHGLDVLDDGNFVITFDYGYSAQRLSACQGVAWSRFGRYHHSTAISGDLVWTLRDFEFAPVGEAGEDHHWGQTGLVALDVETGEVRTEISIDQLRAANPDLSIFDIPRETNPGPTENRRRFGDRFMPDPYHLNDVEPLPAALAERYEHFDTNDLLVSSRTLNTVFVVDPETLKVVWHATGLTRRQHDPDWSTDGRITVFDNRMGHEHSQIVALDPDSRQRAVLHDGAENAFYTYIRGKHSVLENGALAIVSSQQGRVFETDPKTHDTVFELYSTDPDDPATNYVITSLARFPADRFSKEDFRCNDTR